MTISARTLEKMRTVLLDPNVCGPRWTYFMFRNLPILSRGETRCDLTIIPPYRLGREFNKTFGHTHRGDEDETYKVLSGKALFLLQKVVKPQRLDLRRGPTSKERGIIEEIKLISASAGDKITIPGKYYHETINWGRTPLVLVNGLKTGTENDYRLIEEKRGFGYYIVANGDGREFKLVKNGNYDEVPKAKQLT